MAFSGSAELNIKEWNAWDVEKPHHIPGTRTKPFDEEMDFDLNDIANGLCARVCVCVSVTRHNNERQKIKINHTILLTLFVLPSDLVCDE